ncbi:MAG: Fis family transcriptional regulator [Sulfurimonas sp.]|nr:MAG: Fis family transcriptional regulator [Sulfurimonas sp.]
MVATNFVTACEASYQALKTATLLKTLNVNALIMGETGVGKKCLASFILPDASFVDALHFDELLVSLDSCSELIITNIENSPNLKRLIQTIKEKQVRVVATSKQTFSNEFIDDLFSVKFDIPSLENRKEDVELLIKLFEVEAVTLFGGKKKINLAEFIPDLSQNAKSLKRQVMVSYLHQDIQDKELMQIIENYLHERIGSQSDYRKYLYLYEVPLIRAGLDRFGSQLQLSDKLGLNRNTLRKKIADNKQYL